MFEQSLVVTSSEMKKRKRWSALLSYSLEATAVLMLLSFPLIHTDALPIDDSPKIYAPTYRAPNVTEVTTPHTPRPQRSDRAAINPLIPPQRIADRIDMRPDPPQEPAGESTPCVGCIPVPTGNDRANPVIEAMLHNVPVPPPIPHVAAPVPRSSHAQEGLLIRQVKPSYPAIAIQTHTQGAVLLHAIIGRDGTIQNLQVVSGHPLLVRAALEAVRQWRYRPYLLNGDPVEVETQITVNFTLNSN